MHNSLIMSRLKYQHEAPSRLTEGRGNETLCSGAKQHRVGTKRQLLPVLEDSTAEDKVRPELRLESGRYANERVEVKTAAEIESLSNSAQRF